MPESKDVFFFHFCIYLPTILLVSVDRFACLGGFVSLVSVVSFRWFRFVVSGFSTCLYGLGSTHEKIDF